MSHLSPKQSVSIFIFLPKSRSLALINASLEPEQMAC